MSQNIDTQDVVEAPVNLDQLKETALSNFELLLDYWKLSYRKIMDYEYEIIATWRDDRSFGSVRFNTFKARGADFAGSSLTEEDYTRLGKGFDKSDFAGFSNGVQGSIGFDIIGLCQRVHLSNSYKEATIKLKADIEALSGATGTSFRIASAEAAKRRQAEQLAKEKKIRKIVTDVWNSCRFHKLEGSVGEKYIRNRLIKNLDVKTLQNSVRFHPGISYKPTNSVYPALLFKVQKSPDDPIIALHRIFLDNSGNKANVPNPKMALAPIKGAGIWFGKKYPILTITEGPENALSLLELGFDFVVSTIFGTNFHNISIPGYVSKVYLVPDVDKAGLEALERAEITYGKLGIEIESMTIPRIEKPNGKVLDINDLLGGLL